MHLLSQRLIVIFCLMLGWGLGIQGFSQDIIPYLQSPTDTTIWISWRTNSGTETTIKFGTDSTQLNQTTDGDYQKLEDPEYIGDYYYHSVQLKNLQPSTLYYYKVNTGSSESKIFRFKTQPSIGSNNEHYRFLIFGDHQVPDRDGYQRLMQAAKDRVFQKYGGSVEENINLIINDGDQVDLYIMAI